MLFKSFVRRLGGWSEEDFLERFSHPFLLEVGSTKPGRRVYRLNSSDGLRLIVGRGQYCHVRLVEQSVSTAHAKLLPPSGAKLPWQIHDMGSSNGTFLDGLALSKELRPLANGSVLTFGPLAKFEFLNARSVLQKLPPLSDLPPPNAEHSTERFSRNTPDVDDVSEDPAAEGEELLLICDTLDPIALKVGVTVVVGRSPKADLLLPDDQVSRRHAEFQRRADGVYVKDLGSVNGTLLNGERLQDGWTRLPLGKQVVIGRWHLYAGRPQSSTQILQAVPDQD